MRKWWRRRKRKRGCFHHATRYSLPNAHVTGEQVSYIVVEGYLTDGRRAFRCSPHKGGCGKLWLA